MRPDQLPGKAYGPWRKPDIQQVKLHNVDRRSVAGLAPGLRAACQGEDYRVTRCNG